jgi:hypothetical protein
MILAAMDMCSGIFLCLMLLKPGFSCPCYIFSRANPVNVVFNSVLFPRIISPFWMFLTPLVVCLVYKSSSVTVGIPQIPHCFRIAERDSHSTSHGHDYPVWRFKFGSFDRVYLRRKAYRCAFYMAFLVAECLSRELG